MLFFYIICTSILYIYTFKGPNKSKNLEQRHWSAAPTHQPSGHHEAPWRAAFQGGAPDLGLLVGCNRSPKSMLFFGRCLKRLKVGPCFLKAEYLCKRRQGNDSIPKSMFLFCSMQLYTALNQVICTKGSTGAQAAPKNWCLCRPLRQTQLITHLLKCR